MTTRHYLYLILITTGSIIVGVDGIDKSWNLWPLITALVFFETIIYAGGKKWNKLTLTLRYTSAGLIIGTVTLPLLFHIAWEFNIAGAGTGSMAWQVFWLIPIFAFALGFIGGLTGFIIGNHKRKQIN